MKKPKIAAIPDATVDTSFTERTKAAKKKAANPKGKAVKKSFSLTETDLTYVEKLALKLGQKRGKSMSDSEALRVIIQHHKQGEPA